MEFNRAAEVFFGRDRSAVLGQQMWEVFPQGIGTPFEANCRAAMEQGLASAMETGSALRPGRAVEIRIMPIRGGGIAVSLTDVTERRLADRRQRLLVNELNHRVKNSLATVQAIAAQSLRGEEVSATARERFMGRLLALAQANDILVAQEWRGADLRTIAAQVASPYGGQTDGDRFTIEGPPVQLGGSAATAMALGLHELATNAAKYGALSSPVGRVVLSWTVKGEGEGRSLNLTWRESGGPPVRTPQRTGFGTRLIERGLKGELKAQVTLDYAPSGLMFSLTAPLEEPPADYEGVETP